MSGAGYESWFLSVRSPDGARAAWLRRTTLRDPYGRVQTADWCTVFADGTASAVKELRAGGDVEVDADVAASGTTFRGQARMGALRRRWDVHIAGRDDPLRPLRPAVLYRLPFPRTKLEVPVPLGAGSGSIAVGEDIWSLDDWPCTVGHNWGREHADRWVWVHAAGLGPLRWLDLVLARTRVGGALTPWLATGAAGTLSGRVFLGGFRHRPVVEALSATGIDIRLPTATGALTITARAGDAATIGVLYPDPHQGGGDQGGHRVAHTGLADLQAHLTDARGGRRFTATAPAALEIGARGAWTDLPIADLPSEAPRRAGLAAAGVSASRGRAPRRTDRQ